MVWFSLSFDNGCHSVSFMNMLRELILDYWIFPWCLPQNSLSSPFNETCLKKYKERRFTSLSSRKLDSVLRCSSSFRFISISILSNLADRWLDLLYFFLSSIAITGNHLLGECNGMLQYLSLFSDLRSLLHSSHPPIHMGSSVFMLFRLLFGW